MPGGLARVSDADDLHVRAVPAEAGPLAPLAAESLGVLARLLTERKPDSVDAIRKAILTAQYHDAW